MRNDESGFALIEVLVSALLVALIATGVMAGLEVAQQRLVEGLHAVVLALLDYLVQAPGLERVHDHVAHAAGHPQDLAHGDAAAAVGARDQPL